MPIDRRRYPPDWESIASGVKQRANWVCEVCGKQCRRPGEQFDTHKRTLTVAHINHTPEDCEPNNLIAACAPCHLEYDRPMKRMRRIVNKREKAAKSEKIIEIKQSQFNHPDITSGVHANGPPNTFIRQDSGQWFVVTTKMPEVGVRATVQRWGFEKFVRVHCLPIEN